MTHRSRATEPLQLSPPSEVVHVLGRDPDVNDARQDVAQDQEGHHHVKAKQRRGHAVQDAKSKVVQKVPGRFGALVVVPHHPNQEVHGDLERASNGEGLGMEQEAEREKGVSGRMREVRGGRKGDSLFGKSVKSFISDMSS